MGPEPDLQYLRASGPSGLPQAAAQRTHACPGAGTARAVSIQAGSPLLRANVVLRRGLPNPPEQGGVVKASSAFSLNRALCSADTRGNAVASG